MKNIIEAYGKSPFQAPPLFDKMLTIEGHAVDTATYRQEQRKEPEVETKKKPLVGSVFSRFMDGFM